MATPVKKMNSIFADDFGSKKRRTKKLLTMKKMTLIAAILVFAAVVAGFIFYHFAAQKTDINTNTRIVAENQGKSPLSSSDKESVREDGNGSVGGDQDSSSGVEDEEARNS